MSVRAKFRCLEITTRYDGTACIKLRPVQQKGVNAEENKTFWEYSPDGESELWFYRGKHPFEIGAYYYIDLVRHEFVPSDEMRRGANPPWSVESFQSYESHAGTVNMRGSRVYDWQNGRPEGFTGGSLRIGMSAKAAEGAIRQLNAPGSWWDVKFTFAEASDGES